MAFTVEDGSGVTLANSYETVAEFRDHHTDRGRDVLVATFPDTDVETALVRATDYVDMRFGRRYRGFKESKDQGLEWPRLSGFDNDDYLFSNLDEIPRQLKKAVAEYALIILQLNRELLPLPAHPFATIDRADGSVSATVSGQVARKKEKVGPLEEETWYHEVSKAVEDSNRGQQSNVVNDISIPEYPIADLWMEELLNPDFGITLRRGS